MLTKQEKQKIIGDFEKQDQRAYRASQDSSQRPRIQTWFVENGRDQVRVTQIREQQRCKTLSEDYIPAWLTKINGHKHTNILLVYVWGPLLDIPKR
jgi:hypothetical protein